MSRQIDERIVELQFNNKDFQRGAQESISMLDRLKKALHIDGGDSMSSLQIAITNVGNKFSIMEEIATGALRRIGAQAAMAGEQLVKSLSIDQVTAGWSKYEENTKAVQTIMNATGDSIDKVSESLDKLMWFTDETSYNFTDMTSNIGKFTAQGVDLDTATTAMQGIATWAAKSGQGANEASRAMYNLSQALGTGVVKLNDWMSIENANMGTKEFKEQVIEAAKALGTLDEAGRTAKGNLVTVANFRDTLTEDKWFTSDVLLDVLSDYGEYADIVHQVTQDLDISAAEAMEMLDGMYEGVGESAFRAAQEAKTFSDVIDATTDAVSTQWLKTFELIFGNYEEAKVIWTDLAEVFNDLFAGGGYERNEMLAEWKELGGRTELFEGIYAMFEKLGAAIEFVKEAWREIFPPTTADQLMSITENFTNFWKNIELTEPAVEALHNVLTGLFSILKAGGQIVKAFLSALSPVASVLNEIAGKIVIFLGGIGEYITSVVESGAVTDTANTIFSKMSNVLVILANGFSNAIDGIENFVNSFTPFVSGIGEKVLNFFHAFTTAIKNVPVGSKISAIFESFQNFISDGRLFNFIASIIDTLVKSFEHLADAVGGANGVLQTMGSMLVGLSVAQFKGGILGFLDDLVEIIQNLGRDGGLPDLINTIKSSFKSLSDMLEDFGFEKRMKAILNMAIALGVLSISLKMLSQIDTESLIIAITAMGGMFAMLQQFTKSMGGLTVDKKAIGTITTIAFAMLTLSSALKRISSIEPAALTTGLIGIAALLLELAGILKLFEKIKITPSIGLSMTGIAIALNFLILPLVAMSLIPFEKLAKGVTALGVVLLELAGFSQIVKGGANLLSAGAAITVMAGGIAVLTAAIAALGLIPIEATIQGIGALGVILTELGLFSLALSKLQPGNLLAGAAAVDLIAAALIPLTLSVLALSLLDLASVGTGLLALAGILLEVAVAMEAFSKIGLKGVAGAAGLTMIAVGITALVPAFLALSMLSLSNIATGLIAIGGALGIFIAAATLASGVAGGILSLSVSLATLGLTFAAIIAAVGILANGFSDLAAGFVLFASVGEQEANRAAANIVKSLMAIVAGILGMAEEIKMASVIMFGMLIAAAAEVLPQLINTVVEGLTLLLETIAEYSPRIWEAILTIIRYIRDNIGEFTELAVEIVISFVTGLIQGIADSIDEIISALESAVETIGDALWNALLDLGKYLAKKVVQIGKDIGNGLISGIKSVAGKIFGTSEEVGGEAIEGLRVGVDAHSDSQLSMAVGEDVGGGLKTGLFKSIPSIKDKAIETAKKGVIEPIKNTLSKDTGEKGTKDYLQGVIDSITGSKPSVSTASSDVAETAADSAIKTASNKKIGSTVTQKVAEEIEEDDSLEKAAKEKAQQVSDIFSTEFKKIDLSLSNIGYEFDIWKASQGPDIDESLLKNAELAQAQKQLQEYAKQYQVAYDNYQYLVNNPDLVQSPTELAEKQSEYMKYLAQVYKQAESIAEMQKEMADDYAIGMQIAQEEIIALQSQQAALIPKDFEYSEATKNAYQSYLDAATDAQKQYFYEIWRDLADQDYSTAGIPKINGEALKKEVLKDLGIDPDNAVEGYINVEETVKNLISQTAQSYLTGMEESYSEIIGSYSESIDEGTATILDEVQGKYPEFEKVGEKMVDYTASGVTKSSPKVARAGVEVNNDAIIAVNQKTPDWEVVGQGMMDGIRKGIADRRAAVIEEAIEVALAALAAAKQALGIASPSKKFAELGAFSAMGFALGLANTKDNVEAAATNVAESAIDPIFSAGRLVQDMFDDVDPVMTPLIDMSQVEQSIRTLDAMWTESTRRIVGDISASEINRNAELDVPKNNEPTQIIYNETFTQNNTSPKSLSAVDIYRQTNNLLNRGRRYQAR